MKICVQRVLEASVHIDDIEISKIHRGLLLFVCLEVGDQMDKVTEAAEKIAKLRVFENEERKMTYDLATINGEILSISQFTLSWDGSGGHRPSFSGSLDPANARLLYSQFNKKLRDYGIEVKEGRFGADMKVNITNDGPATFILTF